jgi:hypothetical protein
MVTRGGEKTRELYTTLWHLLTLKPIPKTIYLGLNFPIIDNAYFGLIKSAYQNADSDIRIFHFLPENSVAMMRVTLYTHVLTVCGEQFVVNLDDDILLSNKGWNDLCQIKDYPFLLIPCYDVVNTRNYADWKATPRSSKDWNIYPTQHLGQFQNWDNYYTFGLYSQKNWYASNMLVSLPYLCSVPGIINEWYSYPRGKRGYDALVAPRVDLKDVAILFSASSPHIGVTTPHLNEDWTSDPHMPSTK